MASLNFDRYIKVNESNERYRYNRRGNVIIYVHGSCTMNGRYGAKAGIGIWFSNYHCLNVSAPVLGRRATNIVAETQAAIVACKIALRNNLRKIVIRTNMLYLIKCMRNYVKIWRKNGYINLKGNPVANRELIQELDELMQHLKVKFEKIPAHMYGCGRAYIMARNGSHYYQGSNGY